MKIDFPARVIFFNNLIHAITLILNRRQNHVFQGGYCHIFLILHTDVLHNPEKALFLLALATYRQ